MKCSQCKLNFSENQCFLNKATEEIWCVFCMSKEKHKRERERYNFKRY